MPDKPTSSSPDKESEGLFSRLLGGWFGATEAKPDAAQSINPSTKDISCQSNAPDLPSNIPVANCERVLFLTDRVAPPCDAVIDKPFSEDAINIKANGQCVRGNKILDTVIGSVFDPNREFATKAHRDAIQLIPTKSSLSNYQFMAGTLEDTIIDNNHILSEGALQGVFGSDGLFKNLTIINNCINTQSEHKVTLNGFLNGKIANNRTEKGDLVRIYLGPLRIGGNLATGNVWVVSFASDDEYRYAPLSEIIPDSDKAANEDNPYPHVRDERHLPQNRSGKQLPDTNLYAFPMSKFKQLMDATTLEHLLLVQTNLDSLVLEWMGRLCTILTEPQLQALKDAYQNERTVHLSQIKHQALRHYCLQVLAKQLGSLDDPERTKA